MIQARPVTASCWTRISDPEPVITLYKHEVMRMESRDVIEEYLAAIETVRAAKAPAARVQVDNAIDQFHPIKSRLTSIVCCGARPRQ